MSGLAEHAHSLQPAEYFLDPFPFDLTHFVSGVSRSAPIDGAATPSFVILRHMRRDLHASHLAYELSRVIALVGSHCHALAAPNPLGYPHARVPFRSPILVAS